MINRTNSFFLSLVTFFFVSCTAPRSIISSGKVTPKGEFKGGFNTSFNIATAPLAELDDVTRAAVDALDNGKDTLVFNQSVAALTSGLLAYALDPVTPATDIYVRYGIANRVDVGYKFASGAHVIDAMYQFAGSLGTINNPGEKGWYGSIGIQYSGQSSNLPSKVGLNKLGSIFRFDLSRKDLLVPLVFSYSFGPEEIYGNIAFGLVYGSTFINYGFNPSKVLVKYAGNVAERLPSFNQKKQFNSFGGFVNGKVGFKSVYFVPALSIYHQNYGNYTLFDVQQKQYKGLTIIPSIGLQFHIKGKGENS